MAQLGAGIFDDLRDVLHQAGPALAARRRRVVGEVAPGLLESPDDNPDAAGRPGSFANRLYDDHERAHIMHRVRAEHDALGGVEGALHGSQMQQMLQGGRRRGPIGGQTRFILAKNVAP